MREITFRGINKDTGEWEYGYYGKLETLHEERHYIIKPTVTFNPNTSAYFVDYEVIEQTVGQYTGLKDKNGVEIYEGDILKWDEKEWGGPFNELVEWDHGLFSLRTGDWSEFCEVIGNIHEHPHLLKGE